MTPPDSLRVIWSEGLFLRPQHFQQQERYLEWLVRSRVDALLPFAWGFSERVVDRPALRSGRIVLRRASGVFPDGTPFEVPQASLGLAPFEVPPTLRDEVIHLQVVSPADGEKQYALRGASVGGRRTRYAAVDARAANSVPGPGADATLQLAGLHLTLGAGSAQDGQLTSLPLVRVLERKAGVVELDESFIPPTIHALTDDIIKNWINDVLGLLRNRGDRLHERLGREGGADQLLLLLCNRYQPLLAQWSGQTSTLHPLELHREFLKLAGELSSFLPDRRPPTLPNYDHLSLYATLEPVVDLIRRVLVREGEQRVVPIPLVEVHPGLRRGELNLPWRIDGSRFVIAVKADVTEQRVRDVFPGQVVVSSEASLRELLRNILRGVPVRPRSNPPDGVRYLRDYTYFDLEMPADASPDSTKAKMRDRVWSEIEQERAVFVMVPPAVLPGIEVQMWAIRDTLG